MKLGIGSYAFSWAVGVPGHQPSLPVDAFSLVRKVSSLQVNCVQIADNLPLDNSDAESVSRLIELSEDLGVSVELGTRGLHIEKVTRYLDLAHQFNAPFLRLVIDDYGFEPDQSSIVRDIKQLIPICRDKNVILAIENHDRFMARQLAEIVEATDPEWVGICLDTANSLGAGEGIAEVLEQLWNYTVNLHVKDIKIERVPSNMGFKVTGCPAGEGVIDVPLLLHSLSKNQRFFSVTLEMWSDFLDNLDSTIAREQEWVIKSVDYLKRIIEPYQE
ncbi:MAG: endonuclease [Cyclobacteriaceae bacterium]|nr:MAG: endonuclease [Cyclobacteriaceae bacterium]